MSIDIEYKEFTLKDWEVNIEYKDKPGINSSDIILIFENIKPEDLKIGDKLTTDFRDGQYLRIKNIENNKVTINLITCDKKEYLNFFDLIKGTIYYKVPNFDYSISEGEKYFTPDREDFKEGFEYEKLYNTYSPPDFKLTDSKWFKQVFDDFTSEENYLFNRDFESNSIRVPFLTKEDIEKEGWKNIEEIDDAGAFTAEKNLGATDYRLCWTSDKILSVYEYGNDCIYRGDCRCINDFRTICKLLNI